MKVSLANKFFIISILLYLIAGMMALLNKGYSIFALLAAVVSLAFGIFFNARQKLGNSLKKTPKKR